MWDPGGGANPPPIAEAFGESNRVFASPLGRGPRGWYSSYSERDVLDVLADVKANYPVEGDRVTLSGTSMGGYGATRIAALHPDEFAAAMQWVGYTGDLLNGTTAEGNGSQAAAVGNAVELLGNLRHVPLASWYAGADELVHVNQALAVRERLEELDLPSVWWLHPTANHSSPATLNDWAKEVEWSADRIRVSEPAHVSFRTDRRFFAPEAGVVPDGAYWVSDVRPAGPGHADVDAVSYGCGRGEPVTELTRPSGMRPVPWVGQRIDVVDTREHERRQHLELTVANVAALAIETGDPAGKPDAGQACLGREAFSFEITTDRPLTVHFSGGRTLTLDSRGTHTGTVAAG
nr:prolyl oligopeptidase family serine peptidase [Haloechinothrix aidingensis]